MNNYCNEIEKADPLNVIEARQKCSSTNGHCKNDNSQNTLMIENSIENENNNNNDDGEKQSGGNGKDWQQDKKTGQGPQGAVVVSGPRPAGPQPPELNASFPLHCRIVINDASGVRAPVVIGGPMRTINFNSDPATSRSYNGMNPMQMKPNVQGRLHAATTETLAKAQVSSTSNIDTANEKAGKSTRPSADIPWSEVDLAAKEIIESLQTLTLQQPSDVARPPPTVVIAEARSEDFATHLDFSGNPSFTSHVEGEGSPVPVDNIPSTSSNVERSPVPVGSHSNALTSDQVKALAAATGAIPSDAGTSKLPEVVLSPCHIKKDPDEPTASCVSPSASTRSPSPEVLPNVVITPASTPNIVSSSRVKADGGAAPLNNKSSSPHLTPPLSETESPPPSPTESGSNLFHTLQLSGPIPEPIVPVVPPRYWDESGKPQDAIPILSSAASLTARKKKTGSKAPTMPEVCKKSGQPTKDSPIISSSKPNTGTTNTSASKPNTGTTNTSASKPDNLSGSLAPYNWSNTAQPTNRIGITYAIPQPIPYIHQPAVVPHWNSTAQPQYQQLPLTQGPVQYMQLVPAQTSQFISVPPGFYDYFMQKQPSRAQANNNVIPMIAHNVQAPAAASTTAQQSDVISNPCQTVFRISLTTGTDPGQTAPGVQTKDAFTEPDEANGKKKQ